MEADRTIPETSTQPHTESSTEAMNTDEGQRTTARLLEEAHHLSTAAMEPSYATVDESMSATLQGSEAAISDILATPDLRELHKSEAEFTERGMYAENILAFDARLLQDIITGRWSRQQMYGSTPGWYQDSFYEITPPWEGQYGEYHAPFGNSRLLSTRTSQPRLLPLGPASDVTSMAGPPSTVGPLASENGVTTPAKKVDFSITRDTGETSSTSSQSDVPRKNISTAWLEDKPIGDLEGRTTECASQQRETFHTDERRQIPNVTSLEIRDMDIMTSDHDVYYGIYPDFQLPLPD